MRNVIITGANGFCGKHLAKRLISDGVEKVYGADITLQPTNLDTLTEYYKVDMTDAGQVSKMLLAVRPDFIFHLAGLYHGSVHDMYSVNVIGTLNLLENVRMYSPDCCMLSVGSAAEYGDLPQSAMPISEVQVCKPSGPHGISKYAATLASLDYAKRYRLKVAVARPFNIIGAGVPPTLVIGAILERIKKLLDNNAKDLTVRVGNLDTKRDFIAMDDVINAYIDIMKAKCWGEIFNICSGNPCSIRSILSILLSYSGRSINLEVDPDLIRNTDVLCSYGSYEKAQSSFGFKPRLDLKDVLKETWDYALGAQR